MVEWGIHSIPLCHIPIPHSFICITIIIEVSLGTGCPQKEDNFILGHATILTLKLPLIKNQIISLSSLTWSH